MWARDQTDKIGFAWKNYFVLLIASRAISEIDFCYQPQAISLKVQHLSIQFTFERFVTWEFVAHSHARAHAHGRADPFFPSPHPDRRRFGAKRAPDLYF